MQFKVKVGAHVEADGKVYNEGDIIETDNDLIKMFPEKFIKIGGEGTPQPPQKVTVDGGRTGPTTGATDLPQYTRSGGGVQAWEDEEAETEGTAKNAQEKEQDKNTGRTGARKGGVGSRVPDSVTDAGTKNPK